MVAAVNQEMQDVLSRVIAWPASDRVTLAQKILETVPQGSADLRGFSAEDVISRLNIPQPAPNDAECRRIVEDELLRTHH